MFCIQCGKANLDGAKFCFVCGKDLYEMLTGRLPIGVPAAPSQLRSDLPQGIDEWIFQAIDQEPGKRFASMSAMAEAMGRIGAQAAAPKTQPTASAVPLSSFVPSPLSLSNYTETAAGVSLEMIWIPGGTFQMGSPDSEPGRGNDEGPVHTVTLDGFWLGKTPITQAEYEKIMGKNPSQFKGADNPVEMVSWNDAAEFCQKLSAVSGKAYTLPTEAQWEYACRAGSQGRFCFGDDEVQLGAYAWYNANSGRQTHPVGQKQPNAWRLFDMHGNVWEWCRDWHGPYGSEAQRNPAGPGSGQDRVLRGGSCIYPTFCRAADRSWRDPAGADDTGGGYGFRVCRGSSGP